MIKRFGLFIGVFSIFLFGLVNVSKALIFEQVPDKSVTIFYSTSVLAHTSTTTLVVDLSSTTAWPHSKTGQISIDAIKLHVDGVAASTCVIKLGLVSTINSSTGTIKWFYPYRKVNNVTGDELSSHDFIFNPAPSFMRFKVEGGTRLHGDDGTTPWFMSNDTTDGSTVYQTDLNLPSASGSIHIAPGIGDIVMDIVNGANAITIDLLMLYHTDRK